MSVISHKHDSMSTRNMSTAERAVAKRCCCLAHLPVYHLILRASRSVSLSINISFILMEPLTFLVRIRPLSLPSRTLTRTCMTSPAIPVLPTIWMTSAGTTFSSAVLLLIYQSPHRSLLSRRYSLHSAYRADDLFNNVLSLASIYNRGGCRAHIDSK
jgi:hypothetical protein